MNALSEPLLTVFTMVRFLSGVNENVSLQITAEGKPLLAVLTLVRSVFSMDKDVSL